MRERGGKEWERDLPEGRAGDDRGVPCRRTRGGRCAGVGNGESGGTGGALCDGDWARTWARLRWMNAVGGKSDSRARKLSVRCSPCAQNRGIFLDGQRATAAVFMPVRP